jgi:hypothetical protein
LMNNQDRKGLGEASRMWQEGWRMAAPYVSRYYGIFVGVIAGGVGLGMIFGRISRNNNND